jgi:hypothetical protein
MQFDPPKVPQVYPKAPNPSGSQIGQQVVYTMNAGSSSALALLNHERKPPYAPSRYMPKI